MLAIFKREFKSYFTNPLGFVILAVFYFFLSYLFSSYYSLGMPYVEYVVIGVAQVALFIMPAITMRLFSDERRQKTDQALLTAPVKLIHIVLGKFFAALALFGLQFAITIIYEIIVASYVSVNLFYYIYSLIGIMLFGAAVIAVGMFISSLTESPIISIIFTLVINIFLLTGSLSDLITVPSAETWLGKCFAFIVKGIVSLLNALNFTTALDSFGEQSFVIKDIIYFVSITAAFIFLTERSLEKRRWS